MAGIVEQELVLGYPWVVRAALDPVLIERITNAFLELPKGTEVVMPGDNIKMVVTLITPIAMEQGLRFAIREGGKTVGAGVVAKVIE